MAESDIAGLKIDRKNPSTGFVRRRKKLPWIIALILIIIFAMFAARGGLDKAEQVETATVSMAYPSQAFTLLNASGYVVAQRKAALAAKATGRLEWLGVEEGSRVKAGQVIARLEGRDVSASREQASASVLTARAALEAAKADLDDAARSARRFKDLLVQGVVAQADYDSAEARYLRGKAPVSQAEANIKVAEAGLSGAEVAVDYTLIRAPFDAVVLTKSADVGDIVTPLGAAANAKAAVVSVADLDSLEVEADVSESSLGEVKVAQPCEIQLDALPGIRFRGAVHTIVPTADRSKATVLVKVRFKDRDSRILPEMSAKVAFLQRDVRATEQRPKTAVTASSIRKAGNRNVVYLVSQDRVKEQSVTLGDKIGDLVEILSGVKAGDKVVTKPLERMKDGIRVKSEGK